jgi:hypothetical protein
VTNQAKTWVIKQMGKAIIIAVKMLLLDEGGGSPMGQVLSDSLLIFGFLAIVLAPMAFVIAETGLGGAASKLLTFLCCTVAAWFFIFASNLRLARVAWVLAWACAMAIRLSLNRHRA